MKTFVDFMTRKPEGSGDQNDRENGFQIVFFYELITLYHKL